jgi:alkylation response protein AidB-like acyl-CoA dehydrogenase
VEAVHRVPPEHLDLLAAEGFYGLPGPREAGGLDVPFPAACRIIEILAGACLSTTFVWMQHHGVVRAVAGTDNAALRQRILGPLCRGERRAGVALVVIQGSGAILADHDAQRLAREALFLLVFGSRPPIRDALAGLLRRPG